MPVEIQKEPIRKTQYFQYSQVLRCVVPSDENAKSIFTQHICSKNIYLNTNPICQKKFWEKCNESTCSKTRIST
jgi:hypothetical protein